ncbi:MAG: hypothetical protein FJ390_04605 [Verrucomicrobia bacterium]|nr:hypothetical protein [Verrucomicrobiota bacterium]
MKNHNIIFLLLVFCAWTLSCSGPINRLIIRSSTEDNLLKAGFKSVPVTQEQEVTLQGFPTGQITSIQRHGTIYYIYPDLKHDRILMGTQEAYARYHLLVTHQLTPITRPSDHLDRDWVSSGLWKN